MKNLSKVLIVLLALIIIAIAGIYLSGNGYIFPAVQKTILKGYSTTNIDDHTDFKNHVIEAGTPQYWEKHEDFGKFQLTDTLRKELDDFQSIGFAVIKDGKLLYEEYWNGYSDESLTNSFSMAKSVTTLLLGKAIEQGYIKSIDQPIIDFIPEFKNDLYGQLCTVGDLSAMRSGFDWTEEYYSPFNMTTEAYFGKDVEKQLLKRRFAEKPGGKFKYSSADTQLLAIVLKRATGKSLASYLSEEFWKPMGMEHDGLWSLSGNLEKSFCCVHSNVRDFAKLGQLLLQKGNWNGQQLLDSAFIDLMITPNYDAFGSDEPKKYGYSIWIDEEHNPPFYGYMGHLGQRIIIVPDYELVIVRLGKSKDDIHPSKGHLDTDVYYFVDETIKGLTGETPRIVNIINFIRQTEPRLEEYTDEVLFQTVAEQVKQLNEYELPGTFLLQYDALINPQYQSLLKNDVYPGTEIGAWWEITQPHVEAAGLVWRGRYSWDWHADVGFATGYTPKEREKLVDVYMEKFKSIFGKYPASVGSWFIDAHSLAYMHDKYGIIASCNCKDQIGTDGYTLWGGYWNQAYYPSRKNGYMPAQHEECQINVPVFRMLGSDPIYQYDAGLGSMMQSVISLEPVYEKGGGDRQWVEWFFDVMFDDPALNFNYAQAGQENSFTWDRMKEGLEIQIPLLDSLRKENKIQVETLEESGKWFRANYPVTPPTAFSALSDIQDEGHKTVWFNSRFYRVNLLWENESFRFRDIHLFDERFQSDYLNKAGTSTQCIYTTLPLVDGFVWSTQEDIAGLRFMQINNDGTKTEIPLGNPVIIQPADNVLEVKCKTDDGVKIAMVFYEDRWEVSSDKSFDWVLELTVAPGKKLPFTSINKKEIKAVWSGFHYTVSCIEGTIKNTDRTSVFQFVPENNKLIVDCNTNE